MLSVEMAGNIKVAEDTDFQKLKSLCDENSDWKLEYQKNVTSVWTKNNDISNFKMIKVSIDCLTRLSDRYKVSSVARNGSAWWWWWVGSVIYKFRFESKLLILQITVTHRLDR